MKRVILTGAALALVTLMGSAAAAKDLHIGVVDMQRAVSETKEGKAAESKLMSTKQKLENELNRKLKEFYAEEEKLRKAWSILKEDERRKRASESREKFETLQKRYMDAERQLMGEKTKVMLQLTEKLNKIIAKIAQKEKFDYIFNNAAVLWAPRHVDITNEVIRLYDGK